jgi:hypothetical protein
VHGYYADGINANQYYKDHQWIHLRDCDALIYMIHTNPSTAIKNGPSHGHLTNIRFELLRLIYYASLITPARQRPILIMINTDADTDPNDKVASSSSLSSLVELLTSWLLPIMFDPHTLEQSHQRYRHALSTTLDQCYTSLVSSASASSSSSSSSTTIATPTTVMWVTSLTDIIWSYIVDMIPDEDSLKTRLCHGDVVPYYTPSLSSLFSSLLTTSPTCNMQQLWQQHVDTANPSSNDNTNTSNTNNNNSASSSSSNNTGTPATGGMLRLITCSVLHRYGYNEAFQWLYQHALDRTSAVVSSSSSSSSVSVAKVATSLLY